jgi:glyoxylase-like metal-dependent hydrolase (beta-lactamase superfamily II)
MPLHRILFAASTLAVLAGCTSTGPAQGQARAAACAVGTDDVPALALQDGTQPGAVGLLAGPQPGRVDTALAAAGLQASDAVAVNAYLLTGGGRAVLVDAGGGEALPPYRGALEAQLPAAGHAPAAVTDILVTHLHADHVGGLTRGGERMFPQAVVHIHAAEAGFWLDPALAQRMPEPLRPVIRAIQASLQPYQQAGRIRTFAYGDEVVPGVRALDAGGHTPGHTVYLAGTGRHALLLSGDLLHVPAVQAAHPEIGMRFETDPEAARIARARLLAQAAASEWTVLAAHAPYPGRGQVAAAGAAYTWRAAGTCAGAR